MVRREYEFPAWVKDQKHTEAGQLEGEIHHKASVEESRKLGVCPDLVKAPINAEAYPDRETHMEENHADGKGNGVEFAMYLLSLQPRLF